MMTAVPVKDNIFQFQYKQQVWNIQIFQTLFQTLFQTYSLLILAQFSRISKETTPSQRAIEIKNPPTGSPKAGLWVIQNITLHNHIAYFLHILIVYSYHSYH